MKKGVLRAALIFIFTFLLIRSVSAEYKEEIFDDWVYDESNFSAGGKEFYITINARLNLVSVKRGEDKAIVTMAECRDAFGFYFCFNDKQIWYHDSLDRDYYKARIKVYEYLGKLAINRTFSSTDLLINERARVDLIIENVGSLPTTNIEFSDPYTEDFLIINNENCLISGPGIKWRGNIDIGSKIKCSYDIIPLKKLNYKSQANARYHNGKEAVTDSSKIVDLDVPDYRLNITTSVDKNRIEMEEDTTLYINFTNLHESKGLNVLNFRVSIPIGLEVPRKGSLFNKMEDYISMTGIPFLAGTSKESYIEFRGKRTGRHPVTAEVRYEINNVVKEFHQNLTYINVTIQDLEFLVHVPTVMTAEKSYRINVTVKNPSSKYAFKSIRTNLRTNLPGLENRDFGIISWLDKNKQQEIAYYEFTIPPIKGKKEYGTTLEAYYLTLKGEYLKQKITRNVEVIGEYVPVNKTGVNVTAEENVSVSEKKPIIDIPEKVTLEKVEVPTNRLLIVFIAVFIIADVFLVISIIKKIKKE